MEGLSLVNCYELHEGNPGEAAMTTISLVPGVEVEHDSAGKNVAFRVSGIEGMVLGHIHQEGFTTTSDQDAEIGDFIFETLSESLRILADS